MPLNEVTLASELAAKMVSKGFAPADPAMLNNMCAAIAEAVVLHIKTNAVVTTAGSATAQTGTIA